MLSGEKVLVTGPAGQIAFPLVQALAAENEVWGVARFGDTASRQRVDALGVTTRACDITAGDFGDLPDDFTYVVHLAAFQGPTLDYDHALAVNAEGTGMVLHHCRKAKAALVMSTQSVYKPHEDAGHVYAETDPLGDTNPGHSPTYSIAKIGQEAVARYCARADGLPVVIARMNASYGPNGGLVSYHADAVIAGQTVSARWDPQPYSPIHQDDINAQLGALLGAASVPATVVNWAGDEAVTVQEWCGYAAEVTGRTASVVAREVPGTQRGSIADVTRRVAITGRCTVPWREGLRRAIAARHPEVVVS